MRFASFLKVDLKQIPGKFLKWLPSRWAKASGHAFDVFVTLGMPTEGRKIVKITKSSTDEEYDEDHATWLKDWKINQNAFELTRIESKNHYCSMSVMKYVKDVNRIASLDWCQFVLDKLISSVGHYKETSAAKGVHFDDLLFFLMSFTVLICSLQSFKRSSNKTRMTADFHSAPHLHLLTQIVN
ncbi:hypothetical protein Cgig2_011338 [Carnegiea gigantea]|uniref:Uncharacterized protein n=1 Tax=Carnegiea gigantea TaxID=171969 RepID=A0A9Q1Q7B0_9CARY|nr:hypothetical protein Cgig2_011338 [Carnegiea gigantea]